MRLNLGPIANRQSLISNGAKLRRRALHIAASGANGLLLPLLSPLVSLLVVRLASPALWGAFVQFALLAQLGAHVVGWGSKEYLLRAWSASPQQLARLWQSSLLTRLAAFVACCAVFATLRLGFVPTLLLALWCGALALDQAFEPIVQFKKAFGYAALVDLLGLVALAVAVVALRDWLSPELLTALFAASGLGTALALALRFRRQLLPAALGRFDPGYFGAALPFFMLGLSGLLQSRADLYVVTALLPHAEVARYQVLTNLVTVVQTAAYFVLAPFVKSIYRLPDSAVPRIALRLFAVGLALLAPALAALYATVTLLYGFALAPITLALGGLGALPAFAYLPLVYALYRDGCTRAVLAVNGLGVAAALLLSLALLPSLGLDGGLAASAAAQWLMLAAYLQLRRREARRSPRAAENGSAA
jgi:O-antigen/teichoic acid export membrane protein